MLKTPEEYVQSLRELDPVVYMKGKRIASVPDEPLLEPGERVQAIAHDGRIELVRLRPMHEMRGFLGDIDTVVDRDDDRDTLATNRDEDGK